MKIYVASKFENFKEVQRVQDLLIRDGHTITCDWTRLGGPDGKKNFELNAHFVDAAQVDFQGVVDCDCLVLLHDDLCQGALIEFGGALALKKLIGVVDGRYRRTPVFYHHPMVNHFDTVDSVRKWLLWAETRFVGNK